MIRTLRQFLSDCTSATADVDQRSRIRTSMGKYAVARTDKVQRFQNWEDARTAAAAIKHDAVNHLDEYLQQFITKLESRGTKVFLASNAEEARQYIIDVVKCRDAKRIVKSKTMTAEEIHLSAALEPLGVEVIESDLGEYIVQLLKQPPFHFVFPAMHLSRGQISKLFQDKLGSAPTDDPQELTMIARQVMRRIYCTADIGISGANFAIAETGMISITENEGNARLTTSLPKVHIALVGIEKVLPKLSDLALFLPMLATSGAGQQMTCYNSMIGGPRQADEIDGPEEFHVVLLDNSRTLLLADPQQREALHCIRCGACLNVCPIFNNVGGHSYGTTYQGPIGSVITPHLRGLHDWKHLSNASSLCGACSEICPVRINLHHHLLENRRNGAMSNPSFRERLMYRVFAAVMNNPSIYRAVSHLARWTQPLRRLLEDTAFDPARAWSRTRLQPTLPPKTFRQLWKERNRHG